MLNLITGLPGSSKTLSTIAMIEDLRAKSPERRVFQNGVTGLTLSWESLEVPEDWWKLPDGSIVIIDECQRVFRTRGQGTAVPKHVSEFETHRHRGFDVFLITQHPKLIDTNVRKLVGKHIHIKRTFGMEKAHHFEWSECQSDPESKTAQLQARDSFKAFPTQYYAAYKSAEIHTMKRELPWKWILTIAVALVGFPALIWTGIQIVTPDQPSLTREEMDAALKHQQAATVDAVTANVKAIIESNPWDKRLHAPRVSGIDASQPFYDELIRPVAYPKIRGCGVVEIDGKKDCFCTSQQGTRLQVPPHQCMLYVKQGGWFDFTKADEEESPPDSGGEPVFATSEPSGTTQAATGG